MFGNHRLTAARDLLGWTEIYVQWLECTDDQAKRILAIDNRTAELGKTDRDELVELLNSFEDHNLGGTGYDSEDLDRLLGRQAEATAYVEGRLEKDMELAGSGGVFKVTFDDMDRRYEWIEMMGKLAERHPEHELVSDRIMAALREVVE